MINILEFSSRFQNQWVVIDRSRKIVDHGADFHALYRKHHGGRMTFYFAAGI